MGALGKRIRTSKREAVLPFAPRDRCSPHGRDGPRVSVRRAHFPSHRVASPDERGGLGCNQTVIDVTTQSNVATDVRGGRIGESAFAKPMADMPVATTLLRP